ncbi:MAG: tail fiber domain-containing protein [Bacteroidota bacterium]
MRILTIFCLLLTAGGLFAQAPSGFKFQGVARDNDNEPIASENIALRLSLRQGGASGPQIYFERHVVTTTDLGVFDLIVGQGQGLSGNFSTIDWANNDYWLQVEIDPNGGSSYTNMGSSQLLSVPYALYASESGSGGGSPTDELQNLVYNPSSGALAITDGNVVTIPLNTDNQQLNLSGTTLSLQNGGSVSLAGLAGGDSPWQQSGNDVYYNQGQAAIGTTNPSAQLHVRNNSTILNPQLKLEEIGNDFARLEFTNTTANSFWHIAGLPASSATSARLNFFYSPSGGTGFDRLTLTGDGRFGINGTPSARVEIYQEGQNVGLGLRFDDGTANQDWDVTHGFSLRFHYGGSLRGFINANTGAYTQSSDARLKTNISGLYNVLEKIVELRPTSYSYISDATDEMTVGFLAQETKEIFPELVSYSEADELYGINYAGFSVIAIKAIQEQQAIIDAQQATIDQQAEELDELRKRLERLDALEARLSRLEALLEE